MISSKCHFSISAFNSQIYGHGYGGQIIMEGAHVGEEEINFKHMVVCKNEVIYGNIKKMH